MQVRKVCLLGNFYVGKTSLVRRFVHAQFDEKYQTTVGVKIDTRVVEVDDQAIKLVIWDIQGSEDVVLEHSSYLKGAAGFLVVADGTRPATLEAADQIYRKMAEQNNRVPTVLLINKADLEDEWRISDQDTETFTSRQIPVFHTSALKGSNVELAFTTLTRQLLDK